MTLALFVATAITIAIAMALLASQPERRSFDRPAPRHRRTGAAGLPQQLQLAIVAAVAAITIRPDWSNAWTPSPSPA